MTDYERIASAIDYLSSHHRQQPTLADVAEHTGLSEGHLQRMFTRWAGVSPKRFLQALTVEHAKDLLDGSSPMIEIADELGLSSASRLYDHMVTLEAMTPGEYRSGGEALNIRYGHADSPYGDAFIASTGRGICMLAFEGGHERAPSLHTLQQRWPQARFREDNQLAGELVADIAQGDEELSLHVKGTNFQLQVWRALLAIPAGKVMSYNSLANSIGKPGAARAVGNAIGSNPVAWLIPCHRVIRASGHLGGYHWGVERKCVMLTREQVTDG